MSVRVRVRNFQSVKDVEFVIDGFAVITGPNNSGKTALMRAIHGVFTNAAPGPLIRKGEAFLSVEIEFSDGAKVLWEKGWEKPDQKGKVINRYTINGVAINSVGKGPPPEVEALGIQQIVASTDRIWPQIAEQFGGVLFLVNRPASAVAEALSDVERVGKLSNALKLSEKDRRSSSTELEIRRKDVKQLKEEVEGFDGLDGVALRIRALKPAYQEAQDLDSQRAEVVRLTKSYKETLLRSEGFLGYEEVSLLVSGLSVTLLEAREAFSRLDLARSLSNKHETAQQASTLLEGFSSVTIPDSSRATKISEAIKVCSSFKERRRKALEELSLLASLTLPSIPQETAAIQAQVSLKDARDLLEKISDSQAALRGVDSAERKTLDELKMAEEGVRELLGSRGICPTCNTVHAGDHLGGVQ